MNTAAPASLPSDIEQQLDEVRRLLGRNQIAQALRAAESIVSTQPNNRDALHVLAVCQRHLQAPQQALATLVRLEALHPDYGRLFQERGHCHVVLGDRPAAIAAYERAVTLNTALPASWKGLAGLYRATGRGADAERAAGQVANLSALPPELVIASSLLNEGAPYKAEQICRRFLRAHPEHVPGLRLLAHIAVKLEFFDDAETLLESAVELAPQNREVRFEYAVALHKLHKFAEARAQVRLLMQAEPGNAAYATFHAAQCASLGDYEPALRTYTAQLRERPDNTEMHLCLGHALKTLGRQHEAIAEYHTAYTQRPHYGEAYYGLANLKTYWFTDEELAQMREQEAAPATPTESRCHFCFALGKALEDRGEYAQSFEYYARGNALRKPSLSYDPEVMEYAMHMQASVCTAEMLQARAGTGCKRPDPIFIVGLPRAGSTLLEQILASHSKVDGTMELPNISALVHQVRGPRRPGEPSRYPACVVDLTPEQLRQLGEQYMADTRIYRKDAPFFIDKMPNNFRHIGFIHLILPNAKIIDARRGAMACCFGAFKQLFAAGQDFTCSLQDMGRYYRNYVELMEHWDAVLPGKVLRVRYEDVVENLEANVRRLLEFCGLEFEPGCIEFHKTKRIVRTASSEQVRSPLFREGLDQWRRFEPYLGPLRAALGPLADH